MTVLEGRFTDSISAIENRRPQRDIDKRQVAILRPLIDHLYWFLDMLPLTDRDEYIDALNTVRRNPRNGDKYTFECFPMSSLYGGLIQVLPIEQCSCSLMPDYVINLWLIDYLTNRTSLARWAIVYICHPRPAQDEQKTTTIVITEIEVSSFF